MKSIRIPIHGFVEISDFEKKIVDHVAFQRLRKIQQLALTSMVYPGATHTRFEHSLGVLHLAGRAYQAILENNSEFRQAFPKAKHTRNIQLLRLYALTHDLGHGPFSHVSDELFCKKNGVQQTHETLSARIIRETELKKIVDQEGEKFANKYGKEAKFSSRTLTSLIENKISSRDSSLFLLHQIMDSELDIDKMDYLLRDSLHCGVAYGNYDILRLIDCLTAVRSNSRGKKFSLAIKEGALHTLEAFILARYWMFLQVYFHKSRRIFDYYLQKFLETILPEKKLPDTVAEYLQWHDVRVWYEIENAYNNPKHPGHLWAKNIFCRKIWKQVKKSDIHAPHQQKKQFYLLKQELLARYGEHQVFFDYANKSPHTFSLTQENNKKILMVSKYEEPQDIILKSEVIAKLANPIHMFRLYAAPEVFSEVEKLYKKF